MAEKSAEKTNREKSKKRRKRVFSYYKIDGNKIQRLLPICERCGSGYFMADHGDRFTCGRCSFTRYKREETSE